MYTYTYICIFVYIYISVHMCTYVYIYIYIYVYTYISTQAFGRARPRPKVWPRGAEPGSGKLSRGRHRISTLGPFWLSLYTHIILIVFVVSIILAATIIIDILLIIIVIVSSICCYCHYHYYLYVYTHVCMYSFFVYHGRLLGPICGLEGGLGVGRCLFTMNCHVSKLVVFAEQLCQFASTDAHGRHAPPVSLPID